MTPGLTLTLDYGHYTAQGYPDDAIEPLWHYTSHFHARSAARRMLQCSMDKNTINWKRVVCEAIKSRYRGFFSLEYVVMDDELVMDVNTVEETSQLRDFLRKLEGSAE
jgi:sugar phosphate isomerase/epimerase